MRPNHALQRTAALAFSCGGAAPSLSGSVTPPANSCLDVCSSFMGYWLFGWLSFGPPAGVAPSPCAAVLTRAPSGLRSLSLGSLGVARQCYE